MKEKIKEETITYSAKKTLGGKYAPCLYCGKKGNGENQLKTT